MLTKINLHSPRTKDSLRHLVGSILEQRPLWSGKTIEVIISENSPVFPDVVQLSGEEGEKEYKRLALSPEKTPWEFTLLRIGPGDNKREATENDLKFERMGLAIKYFSEQLKDVCKFTNSPSAVDGSSSFIGLLEIENLNKLHEKARKFGVHELEGKTIELDSNLKPSELRLNPLRICFAGEEIRITEGTIQSRVCELIFDKPLNTTIELIDLVSGVYGEDVDFPIDKWKNINNALYLVNRRIKSATGKSVFKLGKVRFSRIA